MKLKFGKNENGEIFIKVGEKNFATRDYIEMIKRIKNKEKIEAEFEGDITEEEQSNVKSMLEGINNISKTETNEENEADATNVEDDNADTGDLPF